jgi:hypothetical protein
MSRCLIVLAFLCVFLCASYGQERSYVVTPSHSIIETTDQSEEYLKYYIYQENKTSSGLVLGWNRILADIPAGWDYSLCDLGTCYPGIPPGDVMDTVPVNDKGFLAMNIYPYGIDGKANIVMEVYDVNSPDIRDTLTWVITVKSLAGVNETASDLSQFFIYPNPSTDRAILRFAEIQSGIVKLYNNLGAEVWHTVITNSMEQEIDVSGLSSGAYTVIFTSDQGVISSTSIVKQ